MNRFHDKVALVTGGARGIGRAIALRLRSEGAEVAVIDKAPDEPDTAGLILEADVTDETAINDAIDQVLATTGRIDVLVNNAARTVKGNLEQMTPEDWTSEIEGTLTGAYLVTRRVLPGMVARGAGAIVMIGSVNGLIAVGNPAYSAAKAGLISYVRSLAVEYGPKGIRANLVSPGTVQTGSPSWTKRLQVDPDVFKKLARWYPVGRVGRPEDIAAAVAFLAADEAGFVNGANLVVDGGLTAGLPLMIDELTLETKAEV
ncbi:MAG: SDR family oxidoreductase [Geminicoccaceae bacterium]|nr:SDR family oxidoreductase [Geminicoccaceae bacterium]